VRRRIQWVGVLAAAMAIALFGVPLAVAVIVLYQNDERGELRRLADTTATRVAPDLAAGRDLAPLPAGHEDTRVAVYRLDGRLLQGAGPPLADAPVRGAATGAVTDGSGTEVVVAVPVTSGDRVIAVVRAGSPRSRVLLQIGATWLFLAGLAIAATAAAALLARRQARRLAEPLERLAAAAQALGDGDFTVRPAPAGTAEIDAAGAALARTAERLGRLLTRERAFSADASHQLRTPLTGLRLQLETALDTGTDPRPAVAAALLTADRLEQTIEELLALARDLPAARATTELPLLLAEIRTHWHGRLAAAGRPLRIEVEADLPATPASAAATRHVLDVLLANADRHGAGTVTIRARDADPAVAIDVTDDGPGIALPAEDIFRRRGPEATGHGIGLALARSLAEAEGGRLVLTRAAPHPTFTLLLPAAPPAAS
jgi:signal transduction histidine kinase